MGGGGRLRGRIIVGHSKTTFSARAPERVGAFCLSATNVRRPTAAPPFVCN